MAIEVHVRTQSDLTNEIPRFEAFFLRSGQAALSRHPGWLVALQRGLGHIPYCLEAREEEEVRGLLPLVYIRSLLFGRFLVSLPYLNSGGIMADDPDKQ